MPNSQQERIRRILAAMAQGNHVAETLGVDPYSKQLKAYGRHDPDRPLMTFTPSDVRFSAMAR